MKRKLFLSVATHLLFFITSLPPGFSQWKHSDVIRYEFLLRLSDSTDRISGVTTAEVEFKGSTGILEFDFRSTGKQGTGMTVRSVALDSDSVQWQHTGNKLKINAGKVFPVGSKVSVKVVYSGIPEDGLIISRNKYGSRTFFSDHWPNRASFYLPVVDHPSDKALVDFIIIAPFHYKVVACGTLVEESNIDSQNRLTHWHEDVPLPVKVMAFGAAPFAVRLAGYSGSIPVWSWVFPENRKEGFSDYAVAVKTVDFFSRLIGPYPFEKLANVQSKTIFGGLENASCIFYSENSVTGRGKAESLIAHETAHQWFGNSVTESDWPHIWLSEGFATYLTAVYNEKNYGRERLETEMKQARERVLRYYDRNPSPVIDTAARNPMNLLNANSYQKGAWVLHMLRREAGEDAFWTGFRTFYERYKYRNAETSDFIRVMEEITGKDLKLFFHQWLEVPGQPEITIEKQKGINKGEILVTIEQKQKHLFVFPIDLLLVDGTSRLTETVLVDARKKTFTVKAGTNCEIIPDPGTNLLFRISGK